MTFIRKGVRFDFLGITALALRGKRELKRNSALKIAFLEISLKPLIEFSNANCSDFCLDFYTFY